MTKSGFVKTHTCQKRQFGPAIVFSSCFLFFTTSPPRRILLHARVGECFPGNGTKNAHVCIDFFLVHRKAGLCEDIESGSLFTRDSTRDWRVLRLKATQFQISWDWRNASIAVVFSKTNVSLTVTYKKKTICKEKSSNCHLLAAKARLWKMLGKKSRVYAEAENSFKTSKATTSRCLGKLSFWCSGVFFACVCAFLLTLNWWNKTCGNGHGSKVKNGQGCNEDQWRSIGN